MFRLYVRFQPGGAAERHDVLRRLQAPGEFMGGEGLEHVLQALRSWPRWLARCKAVRMEPPDPTVLAKGLLMMTDKYITASADASFRTAMLRTSLRLDAQPSLESVQAYQKHLQAEIEVIAAGTRTSATTAGPKLRAVDTSGSVSPTKQKDRGTELRRYFAKPSAGCKRGEKCSYSHSMASLDRETRSRKCLKCGSESHRQKDCVVGKPGVRQPQGGTAGKDKSGATSQGSTMAPLSLPSTSTPSSTVSSTVTGTLWTLEALVQAAQQVVQTQGLSDGGSSPEKTATAQLKTVKISNIHVCSTGRNAAALLDSGATHCLRSAYGQDEWEESEEILVELAGGSSLVMRMSPTGTLLMPPRPASPTTSTSTTAAQTIVPVGQLVKVLGYTLVWGPGKCYLMHNAQLCEAEALSLIARIEDRKRETLENIVEDTKDRVSVAAQRMSRGWQDHLLEYVETGSMLAGGRALRDASFLQGLPAECLEGLVQENITPGSWSIMKSVDFLTRAQRRHLWGARRWVVHVFAGKPGHYQVFRLDEGNTAVIELDLERCKAHDLNSLSTWRLLLWGALMVGAPPGRSGLCGGEKDVKVLKLVTRMLWLYSAARAEATNYGMEQGQTSGLHDGASLGDLSYYVVTSGPFLEFRAEMDIDEVTFDQVATGATLSSPTTLGTNIYYLKGLSDLGLDGCEGATSTTAREGATSTTTREGATSTTTREGATSTTTREGATSTTAREGASSTTACEGATSTTPTTGVQPRAPRPTATWSPGLVDAIVMALRFWERGPCEVPSVMAMTASQWKEHMASGHACYRRDCLTCVMARGTGKRHARIRHPDSFSLTVDVAGPVKPGVDCTSKGTMGKGLRYMLVARYTLPREYVKGYTGKEPPGDDGLQVEMNYENVMERAEEEGDDKELAKPPLPQPHEGDPERNSDSIYDDEELAKPPLPQPHEGDPFSLDGDESGEQGPCEDAGDEWGEQGSHVQGDEKFAGSSTKQRGHLEDYEDSLYEPSEAAEDNEQPSQEEKREPGVIQDCEEPATTCLLFAKGMKDNLSATVRGVIQDIVLYLENHGLPVYRLHSDKGETFNHCTRAWCRDRGIRATWSEPGVPQGNGQAEATVRWVKDRARTLLLGSRLPTRLWALAVEAATAMQRCKVLGWKSKLMAPFGATVHIKQKAFDSSGPRKRDRAFETKWTKGTYVGLSSILDGGHVVYVPQGTEDDKEKFLHTFHVRPRLFDPGVPLDELQVEDPPRPRRRIVEKQPPDQIEMKAAGLSDSDVNEYVRKKSACLLDQWDPVQVEAFIMELLDANFFQERKFGIFRHGGSVGWLNGSEEFPDLAKVLGRIILEAEPEATFTSLWVTRESMKGYHKDNNNDADSLNYALPLQLPERGGELWLELSPGDVLKGDVVERTGARGRGHYGQVIPLRKGVCNVFNPRCGHEVLPWTGTRSMIIAYTPQCMGKLDYDVVRKLEGFGYPTPLSQLPEYFVPGPPELNVMSADREGQLRPKEQEESENVITGLYGDDEWEMFLDVPGGKVRLGNQEEPSSQPQLPRASKVEVGYTKEIERVLAELRGPLKVTHTVDPREVQQNIECWREAIEKEVKNVEVAILRLLPGTSERATWIRKPRVQRLPAKFVFTVKPGDSPVEEDRTTWFKRKARLAELYSETPPTEVLRAGLAMSRRRRWQIAILDVVAAFLRAPIGDNSSDPVVLVAPPRMLLELGLIVEFELWALVRALYGLRQAPALWSSYRDKTLDALSFPGNLSLKRGSAVTAWWVVQDKACCTVAIVIIYVDDIMLIGPKGVVATLSEAIQGLWKTSPLTFLTPQSPIRFLGMELQLSSDEAVVYVNQTAYIEEILRAYQVNPNQNDKIPISKELSSFEVGPDDTCLAVGEKALRYLQSTKEWRMKFLSDKTDLVLYPDAAFAPSSSRSHSGWMVMWSGSAISWRSARQSTIALSTAESELLAILEGAVGMLGVEAMLYDIKIGPLKKTIASDSTSALCISSGTGSWRTRHLRLKAGWVQEMLQSGALEVRHEPGVTQPADMLTKALASQRLKALMGLWGMEEPQGAPRVAVSMPLPRPSTKVIMALVYCILMLTVEARDPVSVPMQVDADLLGISMVLLMILGGLVIWEGLKWIVAELSQEWLPGASQRKLRKLRKLRDATTQAIERELERLGSAAALENRDLTALHDETYNAFESNALENHAPKGARSFVKLYGSMVFRPLA
ncbi:unnamed protein product [Symbiodinium sp. CCMP2592]|nr:unnamed protein product [Symbiodinium sp. CCMP2592]